MSVRVDVANPLALDAGALERELHHPRDPVAVGFRRGHVVGVVRATRAEDLGVDRRTTHLRCFQLLEHDYAGALGHDEAGSRQIERSACTGWVVPPLGQAAHRAEAGEDHGWMHDSVPPASMTSASPRLITFTASLIAWDPVAQAETTA